MIRRSRRRKKKHAEGDVQLNMAAMLDMAFQLLAFFILTFKASPIEAQIALRLPDAPQTVASSSVQIESSPKDLMEDILFPLPIELHSKPSGRNRQNLDRFAICASGRPGSNNAIVSSRNCKLVRESHL